MLETKSLLEQKGASLTARADMVDDLQTELASLRAQVESLTQEKEMSGEREGELTGRVTHLELDNKHWYTPYFLRHLAISVSSLHYTTMYSMRQKNWTDVTVLVKLVLGVSTIMFIVSLRY